MVLYKSAQQLMINLNFTLMARKFFLEMMIIKYLLVRHMLKNVRSINLLSRQSIGIQINWLELFIKLVKMKNALNVQLELLSIKIHVNVNVLRIANVNGQEKSILVFLIVLVDVKKSIVGQGKFKMDKLVSANALKEYGVQSIKFGMKKIANVFVKMKKNGALLGHFSISTNVNVFVSIKNAKKDIPLMKNNASVFVIKSAQRIFG